MSSDAHVISNRLRAPASLASHALIDAQRRRALRLGTSSTTILSSSSAWSPSPMSSNAAGISGSNSALNEARLISSTFAGPSRDPRFDGDPDNPAAQGEVNASSQESGTSLWLDLDRFEDWENPTLDVLYPDIKIEYEDQVFAIAVAEDGETLPSELHPSHPYGDLHQPKPAYVSKSLFSRKRNEDDLGPDGVGIENGMTTLNLNRKRFDTNETVKIPAHLISRSRQNFTANPPHWPFKRFGPGQGGPGALIRHEFKKPWRPYKPTWSDLDFTSLVTPSSAKDSVLKSSQQKQRKEVDQLIGEKASQSVRDEIDALLSSDNSEVFSLTSSAAEEDKSHSQSAAGNTEVPRSASFRWGQVR